MTLSTIALSALLSAPQPMQPPCPPRVEAITIAGACGSCYHNGVPGISYWDGNISKCEKCTTAAAPQSIALADPYVALRRLAGYEPPDVGGPSTTKGTGTR